MSFFNGEISIPGQTGGRLTLDASLNSSYTFTFPPNVGQNNYLLKSDGSGTVHWTEDISMNDIDVSNNLRIGSQINSIDNYDANDTSGNNNGESGGIISITSGSGAASTTVTFGGSGGGVNLTSGLGGDNYNNTDAGSGGDISFTAGYGGLVWPLPEPSIPTAGNGGTGGSISFDAGNGGSGYTGGDGGNISFTAGSGGGSFDLTYSSSDGIIEFNSNSTFSADISSNNIFPDTDNTYSLGSNTNKWSNLFVNDLDVSNNVDVSNNLNVGNTLRIAEDGTGLRMTNIGAFDASGTDFRIFGTNNLILCANGDTNVGLSIDSSNYDTKIHNDLLPNTTLTNDLGSNSLKWNNLYVNDISVNDVSINTMDIVNTSTPANTITMTTFSTGIQFTGNNSLGSNRPIVAINQPTNSNGSAPSHSGLS